MTPIKVLIVDDHEMVRDGLRHLLESESDIEVVGEASDGLEGLELAQKLQPDVAVFDVAMPKMGGLEAIAQLHRKTPKVKSLVLSMFGKESFAHEALKAGAHGYVLKGAPSNDLLEAIRTAYEDRYFFSQEVHARMISSYVGRQRGQETESSRYDQLSEREKQVFRLLIDGNSSAEIARMLEISIKTAEKHRTNLGKKLDLSTPLEMMKYAIRIGLVDPDTWRH